jgi:hypothetical protein
MAGEADWKNPETKSQSCICEDELKALDATTEQEVRKLIRDTMNAYGCFDYSNKLMGQPTSKKTAPVPK